MARKSKGYVELFWECPNCRGENLGGDAVCGNCGRAQPDGVEFYQGSHQKILKDEKKLARAKAGADIHCAYCDTRNAGDAKQCRQCGASLAEGAQRKSKGRVVGSFKAGEGSLIKCPNCDSPNAYVNRQCHNCGTPLSHKVAEKKVEKESATPKRNVLLFVVAGLLLACAAIYFLFLRTSEVTASVSRVAWERSVVVEGYSQVELSGWQDEIPSDAEILSCTDEVRSVQSEPPIGQRYDEVCGTPYTVETGGGFAEVVQDCEYQVYDQTCSYVGFDWVALRTESTDGSSLSAFWPQPSLGSEERLGESSESYTCYFEGNGDSYSYSTDDFEDFNRCQVGDRFTLEVNTLGAVTSFQP